MHYSTSKKFAKQFSRLSRVLQTKALIRFELFINDPYASILNNHLLKGEWRECRSINITADIRAIYQILEEDITHFVAIGSHSELYE